MAIELISKIKPKNNGNFKLVDVEDIEYNGKGLDEAIVSGEFKGDKGDRGDIGPIGPTGPAGPKGDNGNDGFSPTVSVTEDSDGITVTVQNKASEQTAKVKNGKDYEHSEEFSSLAEQVRADKESVEQSKTSVEQTVAQAEGKIDTAGTIAVQDVQNEGTTQTEKVTVEGTKQITEIQSKGEEILHSFPQDFPTQMATKLDKQQGTEHAGKALVIGEDGNVIPGEIQSSGGDGIAIVNTASGESPLVILDSAERTLERLELGGKTEQVTTTGKNLFDIKAYRDMNGCEIINNNQLSFVQNLAKITYEIELDRGDYRISFSRKKYSSFTIRNGETVLHTNGGELNYGYNIKLSEPAVISVEFGSGQNPNLEQRYVYNVQLEKGTTATPYEPYTGGKPAPSPEYPQEIKSVGKWNEATQKYEVDVKITGKNLFDREKAKDENNWIFKDGDGYAKFPIYVKKGNRITFSYTEKLPTGMGFYLGISQSETTSVVSWLYHDTTTSLINNKYTIVAENDYTYLMCTKGVIQKFLDTIQTLQVEISPTQTNYEPYKEQTLTLTSDRPLTKWDRLVEQDGQIGWLYGSVIVTIDETASISLYAPNGFYVYVKNIDKKEKTGYCDKLYAKKMSNGEPFVLFGNANNNGLYTLNTQEFYGKTVSEIRAKLKEYPLNIIGKSETTEFVPLPQPEQNAIRALTTHYPTTVITVDGGELDPDIEVTYTADTKNYIDNKFAQLQKSLVNTQIQLL